MSDDFLGGPWSVMPELRIRARDPKALVIMISMQLWKRWVDEVSHG